jgi:hypothetical protein
MPIDVDDQILLKGFLSDVRAEPQEFVLQLWSLLTQAAITRMTPLEIYSGSDTPLMRHYLERYEALMLSSQGTVICELYKDDIKPIADLACGKLWAEARTKGQRGPFTI